MSSRVTIYEAVNEMGDDPGYCKGMDIERAMALRWEAQRALDRVANTVQVAATANLAAVRANPDYTGSLESDVLPVESGDIDRWVVLSDERGMQAAWMIEVGNFNHLLGKNSERWTVTRAGRKQAGKHVLRNAAFAAVMAASGL